MTKINLNKIFLFLFCILISIIILNFNLENPLENEEKIFQIKKEDKIDLLCKKIDNERRFDLIVILKFFNINLGHEANCKNINNKYQIFHEKNDIYKNLSLLRKSNFYEFINLQIENEHKFESYSDVHLNTYLLLNNLERHLTKKFSKSMISFLLFDKYDKKELLFHISTLKNYLIKPTFYTQIIKSNNFLFVEIYVLNLIKIHLEKLNITLENDYGNYKISKNINELIKPKISNNEFYLNKLYINIENKRNENPLRTKIKNIDFEIKNFENKIIENYDLIFNDFIHDDFFDNTRCNDIDTFIEILKEHTSYDESKNINIDIKNQKIYIQNKIEIYSDLVFPCDYDVFIASDVKLLLANDVNIVFHKNLFIQGSKNKNVEIKNLPNQIWGSIIINPNINHNKNNIVNIDYLKIEGGSEAIMFGNYFKGMLSIYNSDVEISNSNFYSSYGEDQINLVKSKIKLSNIKIQKSYSDALDLDWCEGFVNNIEILDTGEGGDGIDFSYSKITVNNTKIKNSDDKGFSIGERSEITINNSIIENSNIGIAIKDESLANIKDVKIIDSENGISSYIKKNFFGNPNYILENIDFINVKNNF